MKYQNQFKKFFYYIPSNYLIVIHYFIKMTIGNFLIMKLYD